MRYRSYYIYLVASVTAVVVLTIGFNASAQNKTEIYFKDLWNARKVENNEYDFFTQGDEVLILNAGSYDLNGANLTIDSSTIELDGAVSFYSFSEDSAQGGIASDSKHTSIVPPRAATNQNGRQGATGGQGPIGLNGMNGSNVKFFVDSVIGTGMLTIDVSGQKGGQGGRGQDGQRGQHGGNGQNGSDYLVGCKQGPKRGGLGGNGGAAGSGGVGGTGGDGGFVRLNKVLREHVNVKFEGGSPGNSGSPGSAGQPGTNGQNGKETTYCNLGFLAARRAPKPGGSAASTHAGSPGKPGSVSYR